MPDRFELTSNQTANVAIDILVGQLLAAGADTSLPDLSAEELSRRLDFWSGSKDAYADVLGLLMGNIQGGKAIIAAMNAAVNGRFDHLGTAVHGVVGKFGGCSNTPATGGLVVYPRFLKTRQKLYIKVSESENAVATTISVASHAQDTVITVPNAFEATAQFVLTEGASQTINGPKRFTSSIILQNVDVILSATTGTQFGTATTEKLGFYGATPIARPSAYTQTYSTADKTNAALTSSALNTTFTDSSPWGFGTEADGNLLVTGYNALRADIEDAKQLLNSLIDDLQALGLVG